MSSKPVSRRRFLAIAGAAAAGTMAAACQPQVVEVEKIVKETVEVQVPAAAGTKSIRLSAWADISDAVVYQNISSAFMAKYPDLTVSVEQYPGGYYQKVMANFAANDPADVIYFQGWMMPAYADNKVLQPLDDFIAATNMEGRFLKTDNYLAATT